MLLGHEKEKFLYLPTPLEKLENISKDLGVNFYMKRDDLTPLAMGGNKLRKLEYFVKDAKDKGATFLLTVGGAQTNHGRLTLAVARKYGMRGAIVCVDDYPGEVSANLLLDSMMGLDVWLKRPEKGVTEEMVADEIAKMYEARGEKVYFIPMGGSNELGILGYYECAMEIDKQAKELGLKNPLVIDTVGSMGTYMGLYTGILNEGLDLRLLGIGILKYDDMIGYAKDYFERVKKYYNLDVEAAGFNLTDKYDRGAYNNPVKEVREAMYYMAEKEAIILDPCYTGKCFAGILEMIENGEIKKGEDIVFIHTGGVPGINTPFHRIEMERERGNFIHVI
ncbi:MAG: pyridoxal-phosphate dependent enzyme [Clostridia bacterium]|nr:pyridoxal-phosphate dependent enzyme [Clostridia bacterium]